MLPSALDERLLAIVGRKARALRCVMLAAGCASDHMHVVVRLASSVSLGELVRHLKGASAHELNHDSSWTHRFAWQDGYWPNRSAQPSSIRSHATFAASVTTTTLRIPPNVGPALTSPTHSVRLLRSPDPNGSGL
jgi:REP element-mobilizing transposase RayT